MVYKFDMDIFTNFTVIPKNNMDATEQLNTLIRLILVIFVISLLFKNNTVMYFTLIIIILFLCYIKGNMEQTKEHYMYRYPQQNTNYIDQSSVGPSQALNNNRGEPRYRRAKETENGDIIENVNYNPFANDAKELVTNSQYVSNNYKIVGGPNPKTLIPPVIVAPISDLSYWKANNLITHSHINDSKNLDIFQSGYAVSNFCGENACPVSKSSSKYTKIKQKPHEIDTRYNQKYHQKYNEHQKETHNVIKEDFNLQDFQNIPNNIGLVDRSCGYRKDQFKQSNIPVNLTVGDALLQPSMKQYNKNLFTQIIQPNVYTVNEVNEPINSNMGISFDQQFEPLTAEENEFGVTFTEHDALNPDYNPKDNLLNYDINDIIEPVITQSNVYDPRFSGYGTSYRAYTDKNMGQTKYFYDDVDSVRMPNYVIRSKIDFMDEADTYGPMNGNTSNSNIRALANQRFVDDAIEFRTGMQERLMRKVNSEQWQQRYKPISGNTQRMLGGNRRW